MVNGDVGEGKNSIGCDKVRLGTEYPVCDCLGAQGYRQVDTEEQMVVPKHTLQGGKWCDGRLVPDSELLARTVWFAHVVNGMNRSSAHMVLSSKSFDDHSREDFVEVMELLRILPLDNQVVGVPITIESDWSRLSASTMCPRSCLQCDDNLALVQNESMELVLGNPSQEDVLLKEDSPPKEAMNSHLVQRLSSSRQSTRSVMTGGYRIRRGIANKAFRHVPGSMALSGGGWLQGQSTLLRLWSCDAVSDEVKYHSSW
jgi:hypothetical protein